MKRRYYIPKEAPLDDPVELISEMELANVEARELYEADDTIDIDPLREWLRSSPRISELPEGVKSNIDDNNLSVWPWAVEPFTRGVYSERRAKACLEDFCNAVLGRVPVDAGALQGVAESLDMIRTEVDALPPETKNRSARIGKIAATHLGLLAKKGRPSDQRSRKKARQAAVYFYWCQHKDNLSYDEASEKTAEKFNVSERRAQQYHQEYGKVALPLVAQSALGTALHHAYFLLSCVISGIENGEEIAKPGASTLYVDIRNSGLDFPMTFWPPTNEQILTIPPDEWGDDSRQLDWWFSNTLYAHPEAKQPIGESVKKWDWSDGDKCLFIYFIWIYLYHR